MKTPIRNLVIAMLCGGVFIVAANGQTTIEDFEYAGNENLLSAWSPQGASLSLSSWVAARSTGTKSMRVDRTFAAATWDTEIITGPPLAAPMAIAPAQYVTLRVA